MPKMSCAVDFLQLGRISKQVDTYVVAAPPLADERVALGEAAELALVLELESESELELDVVVAAAAAALTSETLNSRTSLI